MIILILSRIVFSIHIHLSKHNSDRFIAATVVPTRIESFRAKARSTWMWSEIQQKWRRLSLSLWEIGVESSLDLCGILPIPNLPANDLSACELSRQVAKWLLDLFNQLSHLFNLCPCDRLGAFQRLFIWTMSRPVQNWSLLRAVVLGHDATLSHDCMPLFGTESDSITVSAIHCKRILAIDIWWDEVW